MRFREITEGAVKDLEKDLRDPKGYDAIDHMMQTIAQRRGISPQQLHDLFVKKHGVTPDSWARERLDELMFMGMSPCTKDCSGHRAGYEWSARHNNAHSASWSDSFNRGAAIKAAGY